MIVSYVFADGYKMEVEVDEAIGTYIMDSRRMENNLERKERYHCYSLDSLIYGDKDIYAPATHETPDSIVIQNEETARVQNALRNLTLTQQRRLQLLADGLSIREIARLEGVDHKAVLESIMAARRKILKYL